MIFILNNCINSNFKSYINACNHTHSKSSIMYYFMLFLAHNLLLILILTIIIHDIILNYIYLIIYFNFPIIKLNHLKKSISF
jgi:hypothetical protein